MHIKCQIFFSESASLLLNVKMFTDAFHITKLYLLKFEDVNVPYVVHAAQGFWVVWRKLKVSLKKLHKNCLKKCIFGPYNTIDLEFLKLTFLVIVGFKYSRKTANPYTSKAYDASIT